MMIIIAIPLQETGTTCNMTGEPKIKAQVRGKGAHHYRELVSNYLK
jgi:hypothetical protein